MGLSFVHSGFVVAGLAAAALPIVIHLLLRQRARMVPIGSVRFLKRVIHEHTRRRKIRQWLLLAMRVLAVLLLAVLFARPYFDRTAFEGRNREVAILVDRSASMKARGAGAGSAYDFALQEAKRELAALDENTAVHLAFFDDSGVAEVAIQDLDGDLEATDGGTDYGLALAWARDLMTTSARATRQVVLFTDLQRSGLDRTSLDGFPMDVDLAIRDVGQAMSRNVSIENCEAVITEIRPKEPVRVAVRLSNAGALAVNSLAVRLDLDGPNGTLARRERIALPGGLRETVEFALPEIQADGLYSGKVSIEHEDDLAFDNERWIAFEARHPERLLLVDGQQGRSVYTNETYYLETALRLRTETAASGIRSFEVERMVWEDGEGFPSLAGFRLVVIANIRRISGEDTQRLRHYVESGGNLLFFLGDQTRPSTAKQLRDAGLFPGDLHRDSVRGPWRVDTWEEEHPCLVPFKDPQSGDLRSLSFDRILEVTNLSDHAEVLMSADGQPILIEAMLGRGNVHIFASAADRAWSDWPQTRLFVPLIRQLTAYLTGQLTGRQRVTSRLLERDSPKAGIFQNGDQTVVRNTDPKESMLERISEEDFRSSLNIPERSKEALITELSNALEAPPGMERPNESWDLVMWVVLALLTAEIFLASRVHA